MPLTLVQGGSLGAWGTTNNAATPSNSVAVTWFTGRTSGNLLVLCVNSDATMSTPTGWTVGKSQVNDSGGYIYWRIADNTSTDTPTLNNGASTCIAWAEYSGNAASQPDASASTGASTSGGTRSTGTTGTTAQADELAVALWGWSGSGSGFTWSGQTNSFVEQIDVGTTKGGGINVGLCVATKALAATGTVESTATVSTNKASVGIVVTFKAATATAPVGHAVGVYQSVNRASTY